MQSDKFVRVICGPIGSGKSTLCCHEMLRRALEQKPNARGERKFRGAMVRNTHQQLQSTTLKTWNDFLGDWGYWRASEKTFFIDQPLADGTHVKAEFMALSFDEPADVRRALSLELTAVWLNEWRELDPVVIDGLLMRLRRYPSMRDGGPSWSGAICDTNGPDVDSFHFEKMENPPDNWSIHVQPSAILDRNEWVATFSTDPPEDGEILDSEGVSWWVNPRADNLANLHHEYYPGVLVGKSRDFVDVYLRARYGRSLSGLPVYDKTFNAEFHIASSEMAPIRSAEHPVIIGQDFGRTPASALLQRNVYGQVVVLDELNSDNMGIETFISQKLRPLISQNKYLGCTFVVAPDPAGFAKQQIGDISPVDVMRAAGFTVARPATNDPERRVQCVERLLTANVGGKPAFIISPGCETLIKGFRFGYRYKLNRKGLQDNRPDKNEFSHGNDALQYACLVVEGNQLHGSYLGVSRRRDIIPGRAAGWT
jgi:hypothetical protein